MTEIAECPSCQAAEKDRNSGLYHASCQECKVRAVSKAVDWVRYNPNTQTYDTPDGTHVAAEIVDGVQCLADIMNISGIRAKQRSKAQ